MRGRSPWLWPDVIYNLSPAGREFNKCLSILHGFTDKVYHMAGVLQIQNFSSNVPLNWKFFSPSNYFCFVYYIIKLHY